MLDVWMNYLPNRVHFIFFSYSFLLYISSCNEDLNSAAKGYWGCLSDLKYDLVRKEGVETSLGLQMSFYLLRLLRKFLILSSLHMLSKRDELVRFCVNFFGRKRIMVPIS